jgi:hypothetical protein
MKKDVGAVTEGLKVFMKKMERIMTAVDNLNCNSERIPRPDFFRTAGLQKTQTPQKRKSKSKTKV